MEVDDAEPGSIGYLDKLTLFRRKLGGSLERSALHIITLILGHKDGSTVGFLRICNLK